MEIAKETGVSVLRLESLGVCALLDAQDEIKRILYELSEVDCNDEFTKSLYERANAKLKAFVNELDNMIERD